MAVIFFAISLLISISADDCVFSGISVNRLFVDLDCVSRKGLVDESGIVGIVDLCEKIIS